EAACHAIDAAGAIALAQACAARGIASVHISSALVFDGMLSRAYAETEPPAPLSAYGRSKAAMEAGCVGLPGALVIRTGPILAADDPRSFAAMVIEALATGRPVRAADDHRITPVGATALV
ncbi:sugar nucleotide-binding protein, partial [Mycobacterium tuberculosis]